MLDSLGELLENFWGFIVVLILLVILLAYFGSCRSKTNLEKFNSIDIDLPTAGVNKSALQEEFKKNPLICRKEVEHHKRKRFLFITAQHEKAIGDQFVDKMEKLDILWKNRRALDRCNKILTRLSTVLPENFPSPKRIYILDTREINACCLPDGTIVIFRGLLKMFNDDELAWIIGHELGHATAHHTGEMLSKTMVQELAIKGFLDENSGLLKIAGTRLIQFLANLKYERKQEDEADRLALLYMNKAGFDMKGAVTALEKFKNKSGKKSWWLGVLSSHPHPEKRLKNVNKAIEQLKKNPDHTWGGITDKLTEAAKVKAIEIYLKKKAENPIQQK